MNKENNLDNSIQDLCNEIENYKQVIWDAQDALDAAEMELDQVLAAEYGETLI